MAEPDDSAFGIAPHWTRELVAAAADAGEDIAAAIGLAREFGHRLPLPGSGDTAGRWTVLSATAQANLTAARVLEAHTDALAILAESGAETPVDSAWGVFAAEAPGHRLDAEVAPDGSAVLTGVKPWCSLAADLDAALVTAHVADRRQLFRVGLRQDAVQVDAPQRWVARGLRTIVSSAVTFTGAPAEAVGGPDWYLHRPGFAWGGIGVAACWHGGASALGAAVRAAAARRPGDLAALHLGIVDVALQASRAMLVDAARRIDGDDVADPALLALRTRAVVADAVERVLHQSGHALGPGPLAFDPDHAARVADLEIYVRQHHGERDLAELGTVLTGRGGS